LLVAGCWLLVAGCWLLVAGCWLLVAAIDAVVDVAVDVDAAVAAQFFSDSSVVVGYDADSPCFLHGDDAVTSSSARRWSVWVGHTRATSPRTTLVSSPMTGVATSAQKLSNGTSTFFPSGAGNPMLPTHYSAHLRNKPVFQASRISNESYVSLQSRLR